MSEGSERGHLFFGASSGTSIFAGIEEEASELEKPEQATREAEGMQEVPGPDPLPPATEIWDGRGDGADDPEDLPLGPEDLHAGELESDGGQDDPIRLAPDDAQVPGSPEGGGAEIQDIRVGQVNAQSRGLVDGVLNRDMTTVIVPVDLIDTDERLHVLPPLSDEEGLELRESLETVGQLSPITLETMPDDRFRLIDGRHRVEAIRAIGTQEVLARVYTFQENDWGSRLALVFALNTKRRKHTDASMLHAIRRLYEAGIKPESIARIVGKPPRTVYAFIAVANGPETVKEALATGLPLTHAEILARAGVSDGAKIDAARRMTREELENRLASGREAGKEAKTGKRNRPSRDPVAVELRITKRKSGVEIFRVTITPWGATPGSTEARKLVQELRRLAADIESRYGGEASVKA